MSNKYKKISKEEKNIDENVTLELLKEGVSQSDIARQLDRSFQYISNVKNSLIQRNLITQQEIDDIKKKKKAEYLKSKKRNLKEEKKQETLKKIADIINENENITVLEICDTLSVPRTTAVRYIDILKKEGKISVNSVTTSRENWSKEVSKRNDEIRKYIQENLEISYVNVAKRFFVSETTIRNVINNKKNSPTKRKKKEFIKNEDIELNDLEEKIVDMLERGYSYEYISKVVDLDIRELMNKIEWLKRRNVVSSTEIRKAKELKKDMESEEIIEYLRQGYSQADILREKKEYSSSAISRIVNKLIIEGRITYEEIEKAKNTNNNTKKSYLRELVLNGMRNGYTIKEIIASDKTGYATESRVKEMKKELIETGKVKKEKFEIQHKNHKNNLKEEQYKLIDEDIYKYLTEGYTQKEIATYLNFSSVFIYKRMQAVYEKNNKLNKRKIAHYRKTRIEKFKKQKHLSKIANEKDSELCVGREAFFDLVIKNKKFGIAVDDDTLDILAQAIVLNENLLNKEYLKLVIMEYVNKEEIDRLKDFMEKICLLYKESELGDTILQYNEYVDSVIKKAQRKNRNKIVDNESR